MKNKVIFYSILFVFICFLSLVKMIYAQEPALYTPQWNVGDWWIIKEVVRKKVLSYDAHSVKYTDEWEDSLFILHKYEVTGIEQVNGKDCFVLRKTTPDKNNSYKIYKIDGWRIENIYYFDKETFKILRVDACQILLGKEEIGTVYLDPSKPGQGSLESHWGGIPEFPLGLKGKEISKPRKSNRTGEYSVSQADSICSISEFSRKIAEGSKISVSGPCYKIILRKTPIKESKGTVQIWVPGLPWYVYNEVENLIYKGKEVGSRCETERKLWLIEYSQQK
jgi:hypothetical protein